jgi:hypothetical protein
MKKKTLIAVSMAAILGGSVLAYAAYAQQAGHGPGHWRMSASDMSAFADARIAALHAGLALNAEQEKLWPPVEGAMRDSAKKRLARLEKFRAEREQSAGPTGPTGPADPVARLRRGAEFMTERGGELKRLADAVQPLYEKLDDAQKNRLGILMRPGRHGGAMHGRGMRGHEGQGGRRFGSNDQDGGHGPGMMGWHRFGDAGDTGDGRGPHMGPRGHDSEQEHGMGGHDHDMGGPGMGGPGMGGRGGDRL